MGALSVSVCQPHKLPANLCRAYPIFHPVAGIWLQPLLLDPKLDKSLRLMKKQRPDLWILLYLKDLKKTMERKLSRALLDFFFSDSLTDLQY